MAVFKRLLVTPILISVIRMRLYGVKITPYRKAMEPSPVGICLSVQVMFVKLMRPVYWTRTKYGGRSREAIKKLGYSKKVG